MLNWRPVRGIELEIEQIKKETEQIKSETEQIKSETEQLRLENARLRQLNAKGRALLSCVDQHCFAPECSSTPPQPTEPDCGPS
jgi:regulator of replication initiation timing